MDPVQFLKCISFFSLDRIIYWNKLYDLRNLVGLPVWFYWTISVIQMNEQISICSLETIFGTSRDWNVSPSYNFSLY